jgi:hypothetical protein
MTSEACLRLLAVFVRVADNVDDVAVWCRTKNLRAPPTILGVSPTERPTTSIRKMKPEPHSAPGLSAGLRHLKVQTQLEEAHLRVRLVFSQAITCRAVPPDFQRSAARRVHRRFGDCMPGTPVREQA